MNYVELNQFCPWFLLDTVCRKTKGRDRKGSFSCRIGATGETAWSHMESTKIKHARRKQNELQKRAYVDLAVLPLVDLRALHAGLRTRYLLSL